MRKIYTLASILLIAAATYAQVIPITKQVKWSGAGIPTNNPAITNEVNVMSFGATNDSSTDDAAAITSAMVSLGGNAGIIYFPPGKYLVKSTLTIPDSVILRGDCSDSSELIFNLNGSPIDCIDIWANVSNTFQPILAGFSKDTNVIGVASTAGFSVGDYAEIEETNGAWNVVPASWAINCVGQIIHITAINGNNLTFDNPLRITYTPSLNPQIRKWVPKTFVGIEDLNITRTDTGLPASGYQISFNNARNCWVKGVQSSHSVGAHVCMDVCSEMTISGCYFHDAYQYDGTSTRGYGVMLIQHTGQCLVENNVLNHLRHSVIMKQGANGNVAGYNYAINEYRVEFPTDAGADFTTHGHYSFSNLFESNIGNTIMVDSTWEPDGPYTTFYRNRAALYGILMSVNNDAQSDTLNWVGNETTDNAFLHGLFFMAGTNHYEYGNNILGTINPTGTNSLTDTSYYRTTFTDFFTSPPYPPTIGPQNVLGSGTIPAMQRYIAGGRISVSPNPPCVSTGTKQLSAVGGQWSVYPNPNNGIFTLVGTQNFVSEIEVYNVLGEKVYVSSTLNNQIDLRGQPNGVYFYRVVPENGEGIGEGKVVVEKYHKY